MLEVMLENYVPINIGDLEKDPSWTYDYKEGEWFKATSVSKDKKAVCTYTLDLSKESTIIKVKNENYKIYDYRDGEWSDESSKPKESISACIVDNTEWKTTYEKEKPISQNNGTGVVRLAGGWVVSRFGYFRRKKFQDFLDTFSITSIKNFNEYGFDTTFIIKDTATMSTRLLVPKRSEISIINKGKTITTNNTKCEVTCEKYNDILVARIVNAEFWIYEETARKDGKETVFRKMYVRGKSNNVMSFHDELVELFKEESCLKIKQ